MKKRQRIVILGGGFGGLGTALRLARRRVDAEIMLVDTQPYHIYTPWLYRLPSDAWHHRIRRMCEFSYSALLRKYKDRIYFRQGHIEHVNTNTQHIVFADGNTLHYTHLVIALGSQVNFFGMDKIASRAHTLNTPNGVTDMYESLFKLLDATKEKRKKHMVVCGGGATGIELTMEIASLRKRHKLKDLDITLVDAGAVLGQRFTPFVQRHVAKRVESLNVRVLTKTMVTGVEGDQLTLKQDGKEIYLHVDLLAWAGGVKPNPVVQAVPYAKDDAGRILVNEFLEVRDADQVYVIGDGASVWDNGHESVVPPTAWAAVDQAIIVTETIIARLAGKQPQHKYMPPKYYPGVLALGGAHAAGGAYGIQSSGPIGWVIKQLIHLQYFITIMPIPSALRAWLTKKHVCASRI